MSQAIALQNTRSFGLFPSQAEWAMLKEQASMAVRSGFLPKVVDTPEKAITIALKGRELGIPPMHAFSHIHVIQGKPAISSELMLSLIYKNCPGAVINYIESTAEKCSIEAKRPGGKLTKFSFTIQEAQKAGLMSKDGWKNYPAAMLRARVVSIVAKALFADAIMGCGHTPEELGADVDDDGEVIAVPSDQESEPSAPAPAPQPAPTVVIRTKKVIGAEILAAAEKLGLSEQDMKSWAEEESGVPPAQMTIPQLERFLGTLQHELGRNGAVNEQG